jgi:acyl carrier protein
VQTPSPDSQRIRAVIDDHARLPIDAAALADADNLYQAGMTSHASVSLMLGLEDEFDIEFPDHMLRRGIFETIGSIQEALALIATPPEGRWTAR